LSADTRVLSMAAMGLLYEYFAADDDWAATAILTTTWPAPTFRDEGIPPHTLDHLEALLTGRSTQEVAADSRFGAVIAEQVDEEAGVTECGVVAVTDTLTHVLATADAAAVAAASGWSDEAALQGLATVACHAAQTGHRMYCFWSV